MTTTRGTTSVPAGADAAGAPREQTRAMYPDERGLHRARRRPRLLRGLRHRRSDDPVLPDLDARALAGLEDADPLPRAAPPRHRLRPARQRPQRPADAPWRRTPRRSSPRTRSTCWTRPAPTRRSSSGSRAAPSARCCSPPSTPSASSALVFIGPLFPASLDARPRCAGGSCRTRGCTRCSCASRSRRGAGRSSTRSTFATTTATSSSGSRRAPRARSTRPRATTTSSAGAWRPIRRRLILSMLAEAAAPITRRGQLALAERVQCPVLVISGTDDKITPHADAKALAAVDRRRAAGDRGRRPRARRPGTRSRSTSRSASSSTPSFRRRPDGPPHRRPPARAVRLLADRPRPRAPRRRDRPGAARARPRPADRLAGPGPGHPGARGRGRAHPSGQRAPGQRVRRTSSPSPPSTTCTPSRRSGGWTRS